MTGVHCACTNCFQNTLKEQSLQLCRCAKVQNDEDLPATVDFSSIGDILGRTIKAYNLS